LFYTLDDHVLGMKITDLEESADFATIHTKKLFSRLKLYKLSRKSRPNYDTSLPSTRVGGHDASLVSRHNY
jgi:hypothetical protein